MVVCDALNLVYTYLQNRYEENDLRLIYAELAEISRINNEAISIQSAYALFSYDDVQEKLSKINEKESARKHKGVYYTPSDVVRFILSNSIKAAHGKLKPCNIHSEELGDIPYKAFCTKKSVFDPTCGAGEYLLAALEMKLDLLDAYFDNVPKKIIEKTVATINGNDLNTESVIITKIRLFLCVLNKYGAEKCVGMATIMNQGFQSYDFVMRDPSSDTKYDIIVGNPPYVEDSKSGLDPKMRFGNIYANVLVNATKQLAVNGSMGFIIPLSYISTPRMKNLRNNLFDVITEQYILSYADRPDCLFDSVHQKLCILIGKNRKTSKSIYTGNYQYWYKDERDSLFAKTKVIRNVFRTDNFIPKLGTEHDKNIYRKTTNSERLKSVYEISRKGTESVYLNRRETFWMKAYREFRNDPEYKVFSFETEGEADYCYCLINSSLFWWYWISTSDCWHVSKELNGFMVPIIKEHELSVKLAKNLREKLEETKVYVGTKQTDYEYKHKDCIEEIHAIDDYINHLYGLSDEESDYIKNFAFRYRTSGGAEKNECS